MLNPQSKRFLPLCWNNYGSYIQFIQHFGECFEAGRAAPVKSPHFKEQNQSNMRIDNHHGVGRQRTSDHTKYIWKTQQLSCLWEAENAESRISISL